MSDIYQEVTHRIVEALQQKVVPWIKPWHPGRPVSSPFPSNAVTGRAYRGVNILLLWTEARLQGYSQDRWLTYLQAKEAGGHVRKGESSTLTVFYSYKEREVRDQSGDILRDAEGLPRLERIPVLRRNFLFNIEQTEGVEASPEEIAAPGEGLSPHAEAEDLMRRSGACIIHRSENKAFYSPAQDYIQLPCVQQFSSTGGYYATALHELIHWSGHARRLNRAGIVLPTPFGSPEYAFEELIAEIGAAYLCALTGIQGELRHEGYIESWLKVLQSNKQAIFRASGYARDASEYLLNLKADRLTA
ncbi:MAG TPA: zincin-like metallopeptidase domain-containing protein [Pseudomonas sp.]|nr:zincin-like metallopeptidase domain-containing protein [Pseudomonas sp.]